jgi:hypothetical protein
MPTYKLLWLDDPQFPNSRLRESFARGVSDDAASVFGVATVNKPRPVVDGPHAVVWSLGRDSEGLPIGVTARHVHGDGTSAGALFAASPDGFGAGWTSQTGAGLEGLLVDAEGREIAFPEPQPGIVALSAVRDGVRYASTWGDPWPLAAQQPHVLRLRWDVSEPNVTKLATQSCPPGTSPIDVNSSGWVVGYRVKTWSQSTPKEPVHIVPFVWTMVDGQLVTFDVPLPPAYFTGAIVRVSEVVESSAQIVVHGTREEPVVAKDILGNASPPQDQAIAHGWVMTLTLRDRTFVVSDPWEIRRPRPEGVRYPAHLADLVPPSGLNVAREAWLETQHWHVIPDDTREVASLGRVAVGALRPHHQGMWGSGESRAFIAVRSPLDQSAYELARLIPDLDPTREELRTAERITPDGHIVGSGRRKLTPAYATQSGEQFIDIGYVAVLVDSSATLPWTPDSLGGTTMGLSTGVGDLRRAGWDRLKPPLTVRLPDGRKLVLPPINPPEPDFRGPRPMREELDAYFRALPLELREALGVQPGEPQSSKARSVTRAQKAPALKKRTSKKKRS